MTMIPRRTLLSTAVAAVGLTALASPRDAHAAVAGLKFEVYKDSRGGFRWRLKAGNGRILGSSGDGYKNRVDCLGAIDLIKKGASTAAVEDAS